MTWSPLLQLYVQTEKNVLLALSINDILIASQALSMVQSAVAVKAVSAGLGVVPAELGNAATNRTEKVCRIRCGSGGSAKLTEASQLVFVAEIIFVVVVYVCKIATSLLLYRLSGQRFKRTYAIAIVATCGACCVASVLAVAVQGDTSAPWLYNRDNAHSVVGKSNGVAVYLLTSSWQRGRWISYAVMNNILDICISFVPVLIVRDLQMPISKKTKVVFCFALRLV